MKFTIDGVEWFVDFEHCEAEYTALDKPVRVPFEGSWLTVFDGEIRLNNGTTICRIWENTPVGGGCCGDSVEASFHGYAVCSVRDHFSKRKGRKVAFGDALRKLASRHNRAAWWEEYFRQMPGDKRS